MTYKAGLIGLGQIAQGYGTPEEVAPYCHAGGIVQSDKVQLVAAADPFEAAHAAFTNKWGAKFQARGGAVSLYANAQEMLAAEKLDIVGVCVKGPMHFETVKAVLLSPNRPRCIFLEKPPFSSLQETDEIVALAKDQGVVMVVSYSRHWAPHVLHLQQLVQDGLIGQVRAVVAYCGGTLLSFASHTTDLICQFASQGQPYAPRFVTATGYVGEQQIPDSFMAQGFEAEPSLHNIVVEFENGVTGFQVGVRGEHNTFYADVFGDKGRVRAGIYIAPAVFDADGKEADYPSLGYPTNTSVFHRAYDQIADYLAGGPLPHCSEADWQKVNEIGFGAIESIHGAGRVALPNMARHRKIFANG